jgi:chaperonin GroEL (HSP60 family)
MPVQAWNYKTQEASIRHIGPMSQDFYAAFAVGEDNKHINTVDAFGVALAAIQGLYQTGQEKDARISQLEQQATAQHQQLAAVERENAAFRVQSATQQQAIGDLRQDVMALKAQMAGGPVKSVGSRLPRKTDNVCLSGRVDANR